MKERWYGDSVAFWDSMAVHQNYDDYWKRRAIAPHLRRMPPAVLTVGGWYDAEDLQGPLTTYSTIKRNNPGIYSGLVSDERNYLTLDPVATGLEGLGVPYVQALALWYVAVLAAIWFEFGTRVFA